jgi:hypothetical protein
VKWLKDGIVIKTSCSIDRFDESLYRQAKNPFPVHSVYINVYACAACPYLG